MILTKQSILIVILNTTDVLRIIPVKENNVWILEEKAGKLPMSLYTNMDELRLCLGRYVEVDYNEIIEKLNEYTTIQKSTGTKEG